METSREDVSIAIRSAFLKKGTKQRFSLFVLIIISCVLIFLQEIEFKPIKYTRVLIKDAIYRGSVIVSYPGESFNSIKNFFKNHFNLYSNYNELRRDYEEIKKEKYQSDFLKLENSQLKKIVQETLATSEVLVSAKVLLDKKSPYLNSFILNVGSNKEIKKGMAVLSKSNFIGRIVDVNFFSSRVLLLTDLNSKIPVILEPSGHLAILSGRGEKLPTLEYLPKDNKIEDGDKIYTSGKEGLFAPGIPIGEVKIENNVYKVLVFFDLNQVLYVNVKTGEDYYRK